MHLLLIAQDLPDYSVEYANAMARAADVTLIGSARRLRAQADFVTPAIDLRLVDWPRHRSLVNVHFLPRLIRLVRQLRPDVVHFLSEGAVWLNLALPFLREFAVVTTMHDVAYHPGDRSSQQVPRWCADRFIAGCDRIIVHGERLLEDAKARYPSLADRFEVVPHVQTLRYAAIAQRKELRRAHMTTINILFFGRVYAYKGLEFLIRAIPLVAREFPCLRVVVAGAGDDLARCKGFIIDPSLFDIRDRRIPDCETAQLFIDADIVVLPYIEASQSGVLAIAQSFAKAVIVTDVGELGQSVEHQQTGLVVPPRDERSLADAIARLASDGALRDRLGRAGRDAAERTSSPQIVAARAMRVYENLVVRTPWARGARRRAS
jgi:glycosyltransferase involved in cell wall biosynthesis